MPLRLTWAIPGRPSTLLILDEPTKLDFVRDALTYMDSPDDGDNDGEDVEFGQWAPGYSHQTLLARAPQMGAAYPLDIDGVDDTVPNLDNGHANLTPVGLLNQNVQASPLRRH
jgi:hypothetical protein